MSTKDAYKQKIEAELELVNAKLKVLSAKAKIVSADANLKYVKEINAMEDEYAVVKSKLDKLGKASENTWEDLKEETEDAWNSLRANVKGAFTKLKE